MTESTRVWHRAMRARSTTEEHRAATPLELLFDLCFVVAVSQAAAQLHHGLSAGHVGHVLLGFLVAFFAIYWAWVNFTWFASAYDCDDGLYRVMTLVQIAGVLVLAAGVPKAFNLDLTVGVTGYVIMRVAQVGQWSRAAAEDPPRRPAALRYAVGVALVQLGWALRLGVSGTLGHVLFVVLALLDLAIPIWAEYDVRTTWHPIHMAERYGLFTLIVLGESVLAATAGVQQELDVGGAFGAVIQVALGGLLIVFAMWWIYFDQPATELLSISSRTGDYRATFFWGYGHYLVFGSAAAVGAGLEVGVDSALGKARISEWAAAMSLAVPVAVYVLTVWALHLQVRRPRVPGNLMFPVAALLVLAAPATGHAPISIGLIMLALVVATQLGMGRLGAGAGRSGRLARCPRWSRCRRVPRPSAGRSQVPARCRRPPGSGRRPAG